MMRIDMTLPGADTRRLTLPSPVLVGRAAQCALRIASWRVARRHAWLRAVETGVVLEDLDSMSGTLLNGARVARYAVVLPEDEIQVGPCRLRVSRCQEPDQVSTPASCLVRNEAHGFTHATTTTGTGIQVGTERVMTGSPVATATNPADDAALPSAALASRLALRRQLHAALLGGGARSAAA